MIKITNGGESGGAGRIFYCEKFTRKIWLDFKFHEYSASIHRDAMQNAYVHAYDRTANISYMLKEYLKDAWLFRSCSRRRRKTEEWRKKGERGFLPFVRNHENLRLLRFVSIWLDSHRNYGMARSFAIDNWILRTTLVELQIFPFRENFLTVAFDRRYLRSLLCLSFPSLFFPFLPSLLPSFLLPFLPSFSPFPVSSISRCGVSKYQSIEKDSLPGIPLSLVSTTSRNQLFFESPSDGRTRFVRSGYSFVVYKSSSAIRKSFKSHSPFFSFVL